MSEEISLPDRILSAVQEHYSATGEMSMVTGFVLAVEGFESDGAQSATVIHPESQPTYRTLGLLGWADEWVRDDVRRAFAEWEPGE